MSLLFIPISTFLQNATQEQEGPYCNLRKGVRFRRRTHTGDSQLLAGRQPWQSGGDPPQRMGRQHHRPTGRNTEWGQPSNPQLNLFAPGYPVPHPQSRTGQQVLETTSEHWTRGHLLGHPLLSLQVHQLHGFQPRRLHRHRILHPSRWEAPPGRNRARRHRLQGFRPKGVYLAHAPKLGKNYCTPLPTP